MGGWPKRMHEEIQKEGIVLALCIEPRDLWEYVNLLEMAPREIQETFI
jgi:hypothetical protein